MANIDYQIIIDQQLPPLICESESDSSMVNFYNIKFNFTSPYISSEAKIYFYNLTTSELIKTYTLYYNKDFTDSLINYNFSSNLFIPEVYYKVQISFDIYGKHYSNYGISKCIRSDSYKTILNIQNNEITLNYYTQDIENYLKFYKYNLIDANTNESLVSKDFYAVEEFQNKMSGNLFKENIFQNLELISFKEQNLKQNINNFNSNNDLFTVFDETEETRGMANIVATDAVDEKNKNYYIYNSTLQRYEKADNTTLTAWGELVGPEDNSGIIYCYIRSNELENSDRRYTIFVSTKTLGYTEFFNEENTDYNNLRIALKDCFERDDVTFRLSNSLFKYNRKVFNYNSNSYFYRTLDDPTETSDDILYFRLIEWKNNTAEDTEFQPALFKGRKLKEFLAKVTTEEDSQILKFIDSQQGLYASRESIHNIFYERYIDTNYYQLIADNRFYYPRSFKIKPNKTFQDIFNINNSPMLYSDIRLNAEGEPALQYYSTGTYRSILIPLDCINIIFGEKTKDKKYIISYNNSSYGLDTPFGCAFSMDSNLNTSYCLEPLGHKTCRFTYQKNTNDNKYPNYLWLYFGQYETDYQIEDILENLVFYEDLDIGLNPPFQTTSILFTDIPEIKYSDNYTLEFFGKTNLNQEIKENFNLKKNNIYQNIYFPAIIKTSNLANEGCIDISLIAMDFGNAEPSALLGKFQLLRADKKHNFTNWQVVTKFNLSSGVYNFSIFKDYSVESGEEYLYGIEQINDFGVVSDIFKAYEPIKADFEDMFLIDEKAKIKIKFNPKISSFKTTKQEQKQETLGSKYPFILRNQNLSYKEIPISGLISFNMDDSEIEKFISLTQDDLELINNREAQRTLTWSNFEQKVPLKLQQQILYTSTDLTIDNFTRERQFKLALLNWLNNNSYKLLKTPAEGNYIVQLINVSLSPNETVGRMLHTFSATAIEVADLTFENLNNLLHLNNKVNTNNYQLQIETQPLRLELDEGKYKLPTINSFFVPKNITIEEHTNVFLGLLLKTDSEPTEEDLQNTTFSIVTDNLQLPITAEKISIPFNISEFSFASHLSEYVKAFNRFWKRIFQLKDYLNLEHITEPRNITATGISVTLPQTCYSLLFQGLPENTVIRLYYKETKTNQANEFIKSFQQQFNLFFKSIGFYEPVLLAQTTTDNIIGKTGVLQIDDATNIIGFDILFDKVIVDISNDFLDKGFNLLNQASITYSYNKEIVTNFDKIKKIIPKNLCGFNTMIGKSTQSYFQDSSNITFVRNELNNKFYSQAISKSHSSLYPLIGKWGFIFYTKNEYYKTNDNQIKKISSSPLLLSNIYQIKIYKKPIISSSEPKLEYLSERQSSTLRRNYQLRPFFHNIHDKNFIEMISKENNAFLNKYVNSFYLATDNALYEDTNYCNNFYEVFDNQIITLTNLDNIEFLWLGCGLYAEISYMQFEELT